MNAILKRAACIAASVFAATAVITLASCAAGPAGPQGEDLNFYDIYEAVNAERQSEGKQPLTVSEFVEQYFGYISQEAQEAVSQQAVINHSLLSAVSIISIFNVGNSIFDSSRNAFAGSGVIVDIDREAGDAYVVTNAHVVYQESISQYCDEAYVYLYGNDVPGEDFVLENGFNNYGGVSATDVEVVGVSITYDLAVLKITNSDVIRNSRAEAAQFAQEEEVFAGEKVFAVGSPSADGISVTQGIISRDSENITLNFNSGTYYRVMRIDAAVNSGNSGGALYDMQGRIVGIVNSKDERNGIDNIAFALPSSYSRRIVQSMIDRFEQTGLSARYVRTATLGLNLEVSGSYANYDGETGHTAITQILTVTQLSAGGAARDVVRVGDVIKSLSVGKSSLRLSTRLTSRESSFSVPQEQYSVAEHYFTIDITREYQIDDAMFSVCPGDTVELVVERDGVPVYCYICVNEYGSYYVDYN